MSERILMQVGGKVRPLQFAGGPPLLLSGDTPWAGIVLEQHVMRSIEGVGESGPLDGECGLLVITEGQIDIVVREGKREVTRRAVPGSVSFISGNRRPHTLRMRGEAQALALHFSKQWFERVLLEEAPPSLLDFEPMARDSTVLALATVMRDEIARGAVSGRLYAESISVALLSYLVQRAPPSGFGVRGRLPEAQTWRLRRYIHDHLGEDLSLTTLASLIGRSPRQFSSLFKQSFGTTPHRYLMQARLSEGARRLGQGADVAEIALELGFCSQSHFASAFRREYGVTPRSYALCKRMTT
ncbi:MAG TPA: AraC family transcriptional regulator, partial [Polyangiales bacterium]